MNCFVFILEHKIKTISQEVWGGWDSSHMLTQSSHAHEIILNLEKWSFQLESFSTCGSSWSEQWTPTSPFPPLDSKVCAACLMISAVELTLRRGLWRGGWGYQVVCMVWKTRPSCCSPVCPDVCGALYSSVFSLERAAEKKHAFHSHAADTGAI